MFGVCSPSDSVNSIPCPSTQQHCFCCFGYSAFLFAGFCFLFLLDFAFIFSPFCTLPLQSTRPCYTAGNNRPTKFASKTNLANAKIPLGFLRNQSQTQAYFRAKFPQKIFENKKREKLKTSIKNPTYEASAKPFRVSKLNFWW